MYMPNVPNTPMLSKAGELHLAGHLSLKGNVSVNSAYAVSDHVGLLFNGSIMDNARRKKDFSHNLLEIGGGYFTTFSEGTRILEFYGGYGGGSTDRTFREETSTGIVSDRQQAGLSKWFAQVNYSSKKRNSLKLFRKEFPLNYGTALRVSYVNMTNFTRNEVAQATEDNIFFEPVFFTRVAVSPVMQLQYTSGSTFGLKDRKFLTAGNSVLSIGVIVNIDGKKRE